MIYTPGLKVSSVSRTLERNNSVNLFELTCVTLGVGGGKQRRKTCIMIKHEGLQRGCRRDPPWEAGPREAETPVAAQQPKRTIPSTSESPN